MMLSISGFGLVPMRRSPAPARPRPDRAPAEDNTRAFLDDMLMSCPETLQSGSGLAMLMTLYPRHI